MENLLLVAINAKYSHTSLSVRSLKSYLDKKGVAGTEIIEATINDNYFKILNNIAERKPKLLGFSCYIWNIGIISELAADIKSILPDTTIFFGGPEVSFMGIEAFLEYDVDFIIKGEGEIPIYEFMTGKNINKIKGIMTRDFDNGLSENLDLSDIPFVYSNELPELKHRAVYYETTRGCPFRCSFCISSLSCGVRALPMDRIKEEISIFINSGIKKVKLVDRTFNYDIKRAYEIFKYIIENSKDTCFHFEVGADLFDDRTLELLKTAPRGIIQFEAGIQSTNEETLNTVDRYADFNLIEENIKKLSESKNIRLHLDLIAGLPFEDLQSFKKSFNDVYNIGADILQLGFLKMLKGSKIRKESNKYNYKYRKTAPYEILSNDFISFGELMILKELEEALDIFNNSGVFKESLKYIFKVNDISPFDFFNSLGQSLKKSGNISNKDLFNLMAKEYKVLHLSYNENFLEHLKYDYVKKYRGPLPNIFTDYKNKAFYDSIYNFLKSNDNTIEFFDGLSSKEIMKRFDFEVFLLNDKYEVISFDRKNENSIDLSSKIMYH